VRVFQFDPSLGWMQLGADIDGEGTNDLSGTAVSLSADGSRVAIGAHLNDGNGTNGGHVRVFKYVGAAWVQLGTDIDGEAAIDDSGSAVSLSADGTRVAIGAQFNDGNGTNAGHVRVFEYVGSAWVQLGGDIDGEATNDYSGFAVSLSADGGRVAVGAVLNDGNGVDSGHVRVYEYESLSWSQLGADIDGEASSDISGYSVSLSANGGRVAIGALGNDDAGNAAGHVRVYEFVSSSWLQLGADIDGEASADYSGTSVSISGDGTRVAVGANGNDAGGNDAGHVRVLEYDFLSSSWVQLGTDIDGTVANGFSGHSVSLSGDGAWVAIGANRVSNNAGQVIVWQLAYIPTDQPSSQPSRQPTGQPTHQPTGVPTGEPTNQPTGLPTKQPSGEPSGRPTGQPTSRPTCEPTGEPTSEPSGQPTGLPTKQPSGEPTDQPSDIPSAQPSVSPTVTCIEGERGDCSNRGICELDDAGLPYCVCDNENNYWSSERCSVYHLGGQLEDGQCCIPGARDYYCTWQGTCDSDGRFCICDDSEHRFPEDRCSTWHQSPPLNPGELCSPSSVDEYCHWKGRCNSVGDGCECFYPDHYLPSERCSTYHASVSSLRRGEAETSLRDMSSKNSIQVLISETKSRETYPLTVESLEGVASLKEKIRSKRSHSVDRQTILFGGQKLRDDRTLASYGIEALSFLRVVIQAEECPPFPGVPTVDPTSSPSSPTSDPSGVPTGCPTVFPTSSPTQLLPTGVPTITSHCDDGDRAFCHHRGVCTANECVCDDYLHYWPSERCSTRHNGRELLPSQVCYPNTKDQYCSWLGTCNSDGSACVCDDPQHRLPEEQCKIWRAHLPTPAPVLSPTVADAPSVSPTAPLLLPTSEPSPGVSTVCDAGDRDYCHNRGRCSVAGNGCVCDDVYHYWSSDRCSTYHWGRELTAGHVCFPGAVDYYCNYNGVCAADGLACECFDPAHRSPVDACDEWRPLTDSPTPAPAPLPAGQVCVPFDGEYCSFNGYCLSTGDGCACWDELHYWPSERCATYQHGPELEAAGDCCVPGYVDYYCSWMGECAPDGLSCVCHDPEHYWPSDRCQQYHDGPDPNVVSPGSCPALLSIPDENSEQSSDDNSPTLDSTSGYVILIAVGALLVVGAVLFGGYKYFNDEYYPSRSTLSSGSLFSKSVDGSRMTVEMSFNNATYQHAGKDDIQLSIMEDDTGHGGEVDLTDMAGIYLSTPTTTIDGDFSTNPPSPPPSPPPSSGGARSLIRRLSSSSSAYVSINSPKHKSAVLIPQQDSFSELHTGEVVSLRDEEGGEEHQI